MRFILGSSSLRRKELLSIYGIKYETISPDIDESPKRGESPEEFVKRSAKEKMKEVISKNELSDNSIILTADTIVVFKNKIMGKPLDQKDAFRMLKLLQNRWHKVYTAFCIRYCNKTITRFVKTDVRFRRLTTREISAYIKTGEPMDKAGSYAAQGAGSLIIKEIRGSYTNVIGLPMAELIDELKRLKIKPEF